MKKPEIPKTIEEKIYDLTITKDGKKGKITSYFPLTLHEKQRITEALKTKNMDFKSIFSDNISESDWNKTKEQIKKKFQDELIGID